MKKNILAKLALLGVASGLALTGCNPQTTHSKQEGKDGMDQRGQSRSQQGQGSCSGTSGCGASKKGNSCNDNSPCNEH